MKRFTQLAFLTVMILSMITGVLSCKKKEDPTKVQGTASFPAGTSGDLSNSKVSLYLTLDDWYSNSPVLFTTAQGSGASVTFSFDNMNAGNYYLDVWKDVDNSGTWSAGDFVGWYGSGGLGSPALTPMQVVANQTFTANVTMYVLVTGANVK